MQPSHPTRDDLIRFSHRELSATEMTDLADHMDACSGCSAEYLKLAPMDIGPSVSEPRRGDPD